VRTRLGSERCDELPEQLRTREGRRALREARERLAQEHDELHEASPDEDQRVTVELDPRAFVTRPQGRRAVMLGMRESLEDWLALGRA
jgi:hypothetical protein